MIHTRRRRHDQVLSFVFFPPASISLSIAMPSDLECAQHLRERFKALHCAEIVANWSSMPRERTQIAQQLGRDADTLREMLRETNAQLNMLAPIGRLPPEILGTVFTLVAQAEPPQYASGSTEGTLGWVRLSHICRSWRDLSIGTPSLWGRAIGRLPRRALPVFVERAGNYVPLEFYLSPGWDRRLLGRHYTHYNIADVLRKQFKRVESLELRGGSFSESLSIQETLTTHAFDSLEYLRIEGAALPRDGIISPLHASALQKIHFHTFYMPFVTPRLTTLSLHAINNRLDTAALRDIIKNCPLLEIIWLSATNHLRFADLGGLPALRLPRLKRLHLDLQISAQDLNLFIVSLAIPPTAQLLIHRAKFHSLGDFLFFETIFRVTASADEGIALVFTGNSISLETVYRNGRPRRLQAEVGLTDLSELSHTFHLLQPELQPFFKRVSHITMLSPTTHTVGTWERIFHLLRDVETLDIIVQPAGALPAVGNPTPARVILGAVGQCFDEYGIPLPILPLPKLANITLSLNLSQNFGQALIRRDLVSCLQTRAFAEARPVRTLHLSGIPGDHVAAIALNGLVESVVWRS